MTDNDKKNVNLMTEKYDYNSSKKRTENIKNDSINILKENNINDSIIGEGDKILKKNIKRTKKIEAKTEESVIQEKIHFDTYFSIMQSLDSSIKIHHKEPMKIHLRNKGFQKLILTKDEFEKALNGY